MPKLATKLRSKLSFTAQQALDTLADLQTRILAQG
jgi:hypothetical protein